jgi:hypothetical protein
MTQEQHKQFSAACTAFGDALAKIFGTEAPTMERQAGFDNGSSEYIIVPFPEEQKNCAHLVGNKIDWEILEINATRNGIVPHWMLDGDGEYRSRSIRMSFSYSLEQVFNLVQQGEYNIEAVRRLSDNTIWRIGQPCTVTGFSVDEEIGSFRIEGTTLLVETKALITPLTQLEVRKPLFTTADGVALYNEEDGVYVFWSATQKGEIEYKRYKDIDELDWGLKGPRLYSTREAAEKAYEEWLTEQSVISLKDLDAEQVIQLDRHRKYLTHLVKNKIAKR